MPGPHFTVAAGFPAPDPNFLLMLFGCVFSLLSIAWLAIRVWQSLCPPKSPPHHALATKAELDKLRSDVNDALDEIKKRSAERAEKNDEKLTRILVELASIKTGMVAQHQFSRGVFDNLNDKIAYAQKRIDNLQTKKS